VRQNKVDGYRNPSAPHEQAPLSPARPTNGTLRVAASTPGCVAAAAGGLSVPSSTDREGEHPLVRAIKLLPDIRDQYETLLERGEVNITHTIASNKGFNALRRLDDERVLLIDDTFTSGARAQSGASVLNNAGATVVAILPIGRVITPDFSPSVTEYWKKQGAKVFDFDVCCVGDH
jgi:adenine/guanine phosphoribosyltransferase-like PRPP-binding protein